MNNWQVEELEDGSFRVVGPEDDELYAEQERINEENRASWECERGYWNNDDGGV